ncbi:MAG: DHHA1 domain-containing protein [Candidatus Micrarchaeota archaeon]
MASNNQKNLFSKFLRFVRGKRIAITMHREADIDSVASAYALSKAVPSSEILFLDKPDDRSKPLSEKLGITTRMLGDVTPSDYGGLVVVDCSTYALLPNVKERGWKIIAVFDHHRTSGKDVSADFEFIDEESPSCAELIAILLGTKAEKNKEKGVSALIPFALAVAFISDTARFSSGRKETFELFPRLMKTSGASYTDLLFYADPPRSDDKKVALVKALQNVRYAYSNGILVAFCEAGSSESDVAETLVQRLDVAFVAKADSQDNSITRISGRVNKNIHTIKLNEIMKQVSAELEGQGGGHYKAAGARVRASPQEALKKCVEILFRH